MLDPAIKGSAFAGAVEDLKKLEEQGAISRDELASRLAPADLALYDEEVAPGFWYSMASYDRMVALLVELEGGDDPRAYLMGRGARAMQRLMDLGIYNQFATLEKGWTRLSGRVLGTMGQVVYNFLKFEVVSGRDDAADGSQSERFTILVTDGGRLSRNAQRGGRRGPRLTRRPRARLRVERARLDGRNRDLRGASRRRLAARSSLARCADPCFNAPRRRARACAPRRRRTCSSP